MKAIWSNHVIAQSDETVVVEGNHYFPPESVNQEYLRQAQMHTTCPWKGEASYYSLEVEGERNDNAAWYYPDPRPDAEQIRGYVAFWRGVEVVE